MADATPSSGLNPAYTSVLQSGLTLGLMTPSPMPQAVPADPGAARALAGAAEQAGFAALWTRDVPLMIPQEGDVSAHDDPFIWLTMLAGATSRIALGSAAIVLPLRHPLHVAKAALSLERIAGGRLLLGLGSGDRPPEFAAFGRDVAATPERFREAWAVLRAALDPTPAVHAALLQQTGNHELLPLPATRVPMLAVGSARQSLQWIASHADGWASYHREETRQQGRIGLWQQALEQRQESAAKPFIQSLNLELLADPAAPPEAIHLGLRTGRDFLLAYLQRLHGYSVAHVLFNLSRNGRPPREVVAELGAHVVPALAALGPLPVSRSTV